MIAIRSLVAILATVYGFAAGGVMFPAGVQQTIPAVKYTTAPINAVGLPLVQSASANGAPSAQPALVNSASTRTVTSLRQKRCCGCGGCGGWGGENCCQNSCSNCHNCAGHQHNCCSCCKKCCSMCCKKCCSSCCCNQSAAGHHNSCCGQQQHQHCCNGCEGCGCGGCGCGGGCGGCGYGGGFGGGFGSGFGGFGGFGCDFYKKRKRREAIFPEATGDQINTSTEPSVFLANHTPAFEDPDSLPNGEEEIIPQANPETTTSGEREREE